MNVLFSYYDGSLSDFVNESLRLTSRFIKCILSPVSKTLIDDLSRHGVIIDSSWNHTLDNSAIRHIIKVHGSEKELLRGQIPLTCRDILLIPTILENYEKISISRNRQGQIVIIYSATISDGETYYIEEVRNGRHELASNTMYKRKKGNSPTLMAEPR